MKITRTKDEQGSTMLGYLFLALVVLATLAALGSLVVQNLKFAQRRQDMVSARELAQGGAAICALEVEQAFTNGTGLFSSNLTKAVPGTYTKNDSRSSSTKWLYQRTITSPFTNGTVNAEVWTPNSFIPPKVKCITSATVGNSSQSSEVNLETVFAGGAAIISTAQGTLATGISKAEAQAGNVVVAGSASGLVKVDGGISANGTVNTQVCNVDTVSGNLYSSSGQLADYTNPGNPNQLFDFGRFIAVSDVTANHFTNFASFVAVQKTGVTNEGIVTVDLLDTETIKLDPTTFPFGINIRGTLVFYFKGAGWAPTDKVINTADMNINAADLSKLNPAANKYPSGYPPVFSNPAKDPYKADITAKGYQNFQVGEDLPAYMYNIGWMDLHANVNICGAVYSPCYVEIENKQAGQTQYIKGAIITGGGAYIDNTLNAQTIISYDPKALRHLATSGTKAKAVRVTYFK